MDLPSDWSSWLGQAVGGYSQQTLVYMLLSILTAIVTVTLSLSRPDLKNVPLINPGKRYSLSKSDAKVRLP